MSMRTAPTVTHTTPVIPAKAGTSRGSARPRGSVRRHEVPAFAGMTMKGRVGL
jgi:hypothetical protein